MNDLVLAFMRGDRSPEAADEVAKRMRRWAAQPADSPLPLNQMLGIRSPRAARMAMRDAALIEASELLEGTRYGKCKALAEMATVFHVRRYDVWRRFGVPETASPAELLMFGAFDQGDPHPPLTPEAYLSILPRPA